MTRRWKILKVRYPLVPRVGWPELGGMDWRDVQFDPVPPSESDSSLTAIHPLDNPLQDSQPAPKGDATRPD